jgi:plasmid maintenance system killer protein
MRFQTTETFDKLFYRLSSKIKIKAAKKTDLFKNNPFHPSLRVEKLHPKKFNVWSFRVDKNYRIIFKFVEKDLVEFMLIGHHNEIYDYSFFK